MGDALAWIGQIASWIGAFIPRWVILDTTEGAIKYVRGHTVRVCLPGIYWYWPVTTTFVAYPTARQTDRLETQTMETKDGKTFIVGGTITYSVSDIAALVPTTHSPMAAIRDLSATAVHDVCCDLTWDELQSEQRRGTLKTKLKNEAQYQLKGYGVQVQKLQLTNLARARVIKISQSTASEET